MGLLGHPELSSAALLCRGRGGIQFFIILQEALCVGIRVLFLPTRTSQKFLDLEGLLRHQGRVVSEIPLEHQVCSHTAILVDGILVDY